MKSIFLLYIGISAVVITGTLSGCSGMELGGKLGIYAVDEKQDSSRTYKRPPLKCMFINCSEVLEPQGS